MNGKKIDFKDSYDSVKTNTRVMDQEILLNNGAKIYVDSLYSVFQSAASDFSSPEVKKKVDFYVINKDTLVFTYLFYKKKLFQIHIYTNSDSVCKSFAPVLKDFFGIGIIGVVKDHPNGHFSRNEVNKKVNISSNFQYDKETGYRNFIAIMTYEPAKKYLPVWCATGKQRNWKKKLEKVLN